jgi:hypothetical protein
VALETRCLYPSLERRRVASTRTVDEFIDRGSVSDWLSLAGLQELMAVVNARISGGGAEGDGRMIVRRLILAVGLGVVAMGWGARADAAQCPSRPVSPGAVFVGVNWSRCDISGFNLSGVNLSGANLNGSNLSGVNLSNARLDAASFSQSNLSSANITGATAVGVDFRAGNLSNANLSNATLTNADFTEANLILANLTGANALGATFRQTNPQEVAVELASCISRVPNLNLRPSSPARALVAHPRPERRGPDARRGPGVKRGHSTLWELDHRGPRGGRRAGGVKPWRPIA